MSVAVTATRSAVLSEIDALQIRFLKALDCRDWPVWLGCFSTEGSYICISRENEDQGLPLPLMMDDCYARLQDRVKFITEVWAGTFEDYATRHFVQRLDAHEVAPALYAVESNVLVAYTTARGSSEVLVTGSYRDEVVFADGQALFKSKKVILDTVVTPRYLVYPI